jgi:hypothetical protein
MMDRYLQRIYARFQEYRIRIENNPRVRMAMNNSMKHMGQKSLPAHFWGLFLIEKILLRSSWTVLQKIMYI